MGATRLAPTSDAHSVSVILFAVTKASAVGTSSGNALLHALGGRLLELLHGPGRTVQPTTVAVTSYALARGGCAGIVDPGLWQALATSAENSVETLSLSENANVASAFVEVV